VSSDPILESAHGLVLLACSRPEGLGKRWCLLSVLLLRLLLRLLGPRHSAHLIHRQRDVLLVRDGRDNAAGHEGVLQVHEPRRPRKHPQVALVSPLTTTLVVDDRVGETRGTRDQPALVEDVAHVLDRVDVGAGDAALNSAHGRSCWSVLLACSRPEGLGKRWCLLRLLDIRCILRLLRLQLVCLAVELDDQAPHHLHGRLDDRRFRTGLNDELSRHDQSLEDLGHRDRDVGLLRVHQPGDLPTEDINSLG